MRVIPHQPESQAVHVDEVSVVVEVFEMGYQPCLLARDPAGRGRGVIGKSVDDGLESDSPGGGR